MSEPRPAPWRAGASVSGRGTPDQPCLAVSRPSGCVVGMFLAFTFLEAEPRWLRLGLDFRSPEDRRYPDDTCAEIRDILLYRLFGRADEEVEKLLAGPQQPDGGPNQQGRPT